MNCKYLSEKLNGGFKCKLYKSNIISLLTCKNCSELILKGSKPIKKKSNKQIKLEQNRYSIFTNNFNKCYYCKTEKGKMDLHEVYGGSNRIRSIKNGLVVPLCRNCHGNEKIINYLRIKLQKEYEKKYTREDFIKIIGKSYIKGDDKKWRELV